MMSSSNKKKKSRTEKILNTFYQTSKKKIEDIFLKAKEKKKDRNLLGMTNSSTNINSESSKSIKKFTLCSEKNTEKKPRISCKSTLAQTHSKEKRKKSPSCIGSKIMEETGKNQIVLFKGSSLSSIDASSTNQ